MKLEVISKAAQAEKLGSILFVHGICHGAWCWKHYQDYFSEKGYDTHALSLQGHGQSEGREQLNDYSLEDYCDDVLNVISSLDTRPIVIGHSMGGAIVERLLIRDQSRVEAAVFLAPARSGGCTQKWGLKVTAKHPIKTAELGRFTGGKKVSAKLVRRSLFFHGRVSMADAEAMKDLFCAESETAMADLAKPYTVDATTLKLPILVLGSRDDLLFGETDLTETAQYLSSKLHIMDELCHDMQLDKDWDKSADEILSFIRGL